MGAARGPSNWRRWVREARYSTSVGQSSHDFLARTAADTGMTMAYWADAAVRFFAAHAAARDLVEAARGATLEEYEARVRASDALIARLLAGPSAPSAEAGAADWTGRRVHLADGGGRARCGRALTAGTLSSADPGAVTCRFCRRRGGPEGAAR